MTSTLHPGPLFETLANLGILNERRLHEAIEFVRGADAEFSQPARLLSMLVRAGYLSEFQARMVAAGKAKSLHIGKYRVLDQLGAGGYGAVYLCEHAALKKLVAIKVLPTQRLNESTALARFHREARAAASINHPNVVRAFDVDQDGSRHFLVMEYVQGVSLHDLVALEGMMDAAKAAEIVRQAANGLEAIHRAGLLHRDIKPSNILLDQNGVVKILDLGLVRFFGESDESLTRNHGNNAVLGTADFMSPEQALDSHAVDVRTDIYGLGATAYFLLTGRSPFGGLSITEKLLYTQSRDPEPVHLVRKEVPAGLSAIVARMLRKNPDERYGSAAQVATAVGVFAPQGRDESATAPNNKSDKWYLASATTGEQAMTPTVRSVQPAEPTPREQPAETIKNRHTRPLSPSYPSEPTVAAIPVKRLSRKRQSDAAGFHFGQQYQILAIGLAIITLMASLLWFLLG